MTMTNPQATRDSTRGTGSCVAKTYTTSASHGVAWAKIANAGGPMRRRPGRAGKKMANDHFRGRELHNTTESQRWGDGKQKADTFS